ncbi:MAG: gamma-glutamyl-gamma-aminobutyrate hydrolase family protein [Verrucomicrobia bacterium]|nr:gamma-glutamyl-gamma-aminobutyrate hydrolase family protein [Verrucomicrobiota bacterium]
MKTAPLILISPSTQRRGAEFFDYSLSLSDAYPRAIAAAGGLPWVMSCTLPPSAIAETVRRSHGVLLTGGDDVQPRLYASRLSPRLKKTVSLADPARDFSEILLIQEVFRQRKPLLAICRGHQLLNVAFGGSLIVDIPTQKPKAINHTRTDLKDKIVHDVKLAADSRLAQIFEKLTLGVNSTHHQAVARVAEPFRPTAFGPDGIIEALELRGADRRLLPYLLAVQFHPERLIDRHPEFLGLFRSFTEACASQTEGPA